MGLQGDRQAFEKLVLEHLPAAQAFAGRLAGNPAIAEELCQESLLRAAQGWKTYRGESSFKTWLFRIVIHAFRDWLRRRPEPPRLEADPEDPQGCDPVRSALAGEMADAVAHAVSTLPPRQREILVMSVYEAMSGREIASALEISEQNVRTTLHLARQRLREILAPYLTVDRHER